MTAFEEMIAVAREDIASEHDTDRQEKIYHALDKLYSYWAGRLRCSRLTVIDTYKLVKIDIRFND